jgi:hypothetical protein
VEVEHVNLKSSYSWLWGIPAVAAVGICGTLIYITQVPSVVRWSVFATALAIASAAFFTGGIVGFLFGIPQPVQGSATSTGNLPHDNTNLYQVSDWLTKIIVGVGLVEIGRALPVLTKLAENMKAPLGGQASSAAYGIGLTITYALLGFFFLYLWSHTLFPQESTLNSSVQLEFDPHESDRSTAARDQYAALLAVQERVLGAEHPDTLNTRANLARWTGHAGDAAAARDQYAALLTVQEGVLGIEHPDTLNTRANLAAWTQRAEESQQHQDGKPK